MWCWRKFLSPFDCKEIKPANPKGNQAWIFIRRTDTEAPVIWPADERADTLKKTLILGMIEDRRRRWWQSRRWLDSIIDSTDMNLTKLQEIAKDREACLQQFMGSQRVVHNLVTEEQQQVQFSRSVVSDSLRPHGLQHARLPCPSPTPGACSDSCPLCWWCHPTISSSVIPFSSHLQSFPGSGSFPVSWFLASGRQSIRVQLQHQSFQWTLRTDFL